MVDEAKRHQFVGQMLSDLGGATSIALVRMGDNLGLYKTLHAKGPMTGAPRGWQGGGAFEPIWCPCEPDPCLEENRAGRCAIAVCSKRSRTLCRGCGGRGTTGVAVCQDRRIDGGAGFFSEKVWCLSLAARLSLVDRTDPDLPIAARYRLLKVARSTLYYRPLPVSVDEMPGTMDGLALAHHTAKNWPKIALLLTAGRPRPRQRSLPERSRFLAKPYRHDHVFRHIRELAEAA